MFVHEFTHTTRSTRESSRFAQSLVRRALLAEFAATLLHKMSPAAPPVAALLDALGPIGEIEFPPGGRLIRRTVTSTKRCSWCSKARWISS